MIPSCKYYPETVALLLSDEESSSALFQDEEESSSMSSASSDEDLHGEDLTAHEEPEDVMSEALNFPFDLFEGDFITDDLMDSSLEDWIFTAASTECPSTMRNTINPVGEEESRTVTQSRRNSQVISPPASPSDSSLSVMDKLDECMRRTNESRAMVLKLMSMQPTLLSTKTTEGKDDSSSDEEASQHSSLYQTKIMRHAFSEQLLEDSRSRKSRRSSLKLRKSASFVESKRRTSSQKNASFRRSKTTGTRKNRRTTKKRVSDFVCSGVVLKRVVAPLRINEYSPAGCRSSDGITNKSSIHRILSHKAMPRPHGIVDSSSTLSISSFLRQNKRW